MACLHKLFEPCDGQTMHPIHKKSDYVKSAYQANFNRNDFSKISTVILITTLHCRLHHVHLFPLPLFFFWLYRRSWCSEISTISDTRLEISKKKKQENIKFDFGTESNGVTYPTYWWQNRSYRPSPLAFCQRLSYFLSLIQ